MDTLTSAQTLTFADLKQNRHDIRRIALTAVLFAFTIPAFAQSQQVSAADISVNKQPDSEVADYAGTEKQPGTAARNNMPNQPQSAAGLSNEIANPLSNLWLLQVQQNNTLMDMPLGKGT